MLIRMPTAASYCLKVALEQELLPQLSPHLSISIPSPISLGEPSSDYPYSFSIYNWLEGASLNMLDLEDEKLPQLALELAKFLKELQAIQGVEGPEPGQHNWWRGDHLSVYDKGAREQIAQLAGLIDANKALNLWEGACATRWQKASVWVHGDFAIGNMLVREGRLSAIIDFGGIAMGDPACDLVIAWTYLKGEAREIFIKEMALDNDTWLRARGWALWKATFELSQIGDKGSEEAIAHRKVVEELLV